MTELFKLHPTLIPVILTWLSNNVVTAFISSLPAPTKDSSQNYIFWFKFCNTLAGNFQRAKSTALEQSPNFHDAVAIAVDKKIENGEIQPTQNNSTK